MSVLAELGPTSLTQRSRDHPETAARFSVASSPAFPQNSFPAPQKTAYTITEYEIPQRQSKHYHSRTVSSNTLPTDPFQKSQLGLGLPSHPRQPLGSSTMNNINMQRQPTASSTLSGLPRRSTSGRSATSNSPTSYVALMRKQKATVWCDRSQSIDPRIAAAQKAAKKRAHLEVSAPSVGTGRTSTATSGGVVGKIRHGGVPKAPGYVPANMSGAGVPMRLSANEMLGDEEGERSLIAGDNSVAHERSGSGKSSTNSAKYRSGYPRADQGRFGGGTPPSGGDGGSPASRDRIPEEGLNSKSEYFATREKPGSADEDSFGELKEMAGPSAVKTAMAQAKTTEDLRRRGSVDERAMTMGSNVKLFVANPDMDSD